MTVVEWIEESEVYCEQKMRVEVVEWIEENEVYCEWQAKLNWTTMWTFSTSLLRADSELRRREV
jgi:hypothetical protein